jgi:TetR/AcrR family transcriptional regulator, lmrAB and yxaGH operons repressor
MTEPTKGERTKKKLVDATAVLLRKQGYHATGLSAIIDESGAPRGSVYFYFPGGKDELAVAAIAQAGVEWRARLEAAIAGVQDLGSAIDAIVKTLADDLAASNWENGCPVAAVALESPSEVVRATVASCFATAFGTPNRETRSAMSRWPRPRARCSSRARSGRSSHSTPSVRRCARW